MEEAEVLEDAQPPSQLVLTLLVAEVAEEVEYLTVKLGQALLQAYASA